AGTCTSNRRDAVARSKARLRSCLDVLLPDGEFAEFLVCLLLFAQCLVEKLGGVGVAELLCPGLKRTVARDLVVLSGLARRDEASVQGNGVFEIFHDRLAFLE